MTRQGWFLLVMLCSLLNGCLNGVWTGATLVYDRHSLYKKIDDMQLASSAHQFLYEDEALHRQDCSLDLTVFNKDILLAGHVPTPMLRELATRRLHQISGYRNLYVQLAIDRSITSGMQDTWITAKIRGQMINDSQINPKAFKIITSDNIVYVMGDVEPRQAERVIAIARSTEGVKRVVKLLKYYNLSEKPQKQDNRLS